MARKEKKKSSFRGKVRKDSEKQKSANSGSGIINLPKGIEMYKPTPGKRESFDILPYMVKEKNHPDKDTDTEIGVAGELWYKRPFKVHRNVGADDDMEVCLTSFGEKCPICDYRKERADDGAEKDEIKEFYAKSRNIYYVVPKGVKDHDEEAHIFDMSQYLFQNLLNEDMEENEDYEIFPDLEEGFTLRVRWSKESFGGNSYAEASRIDFLERKEAYDESIMEDLPDLSTCLKRLTYEQLKAKFFEEEEETVEEETPFKEDEKPVTKAKKEKPAAKVEKDETELDWDDLADMALPELCEVIAANELEDDVDADDYDNATELAKAIAEELDIEIIEKEKPKAAKPKKEKPAAKPKKEKPAAKAEKSDGPVCPSGHVFGVDTDDAAHESDCDACPLWDACIDKKEEA